MRLSARDCVARVETMPGTQRPIRIVLHGMQYRLEPDEAIVLASQLADAVEELKNTTTVKGTPA